MSKKYIYFVLAFVISTSISSIAEEAPKSTDEAKATPKTTEVEDVAKDDDKKDKKGKKEKPETVEEFIEEEELAEISGFLNLLHNAETDKYYLVLESSELNKEFIYFPYILNGPQAAGQGGGAIGDGSILEFREFKDGLGLYKKNTKFTFDETKKISQSKIKNIIEAFVGKFEVEIKEDDKYLISADSIFLSEMLTGITPNIPKEYMEYYDLNVGKLDKGKTYVEKVKNYTKNTTVDTKYSFYNPRPKPASIDAVTDPRYTYVSVRHLFVEMPDSNFKPRVADQRIGYFSSKITDLSSYKYVTAVDVINRWRLEKKNPEAELSEPVKPIVYWVENSTPVEIRPFVVKGIEAWNEAFEKAGFKNAVVAKIQPDDAEWDAGDVEYNVVRWASTPAAPYSGYGPSIANPRTGEMIAADIVQEFGAIKSGYRLRKIWGYSEDNDPLEQWIVSLTMHEVGHTLGLRHNFKASWLYDADDIHDTSITGKNHIGSVMDYDPINIAPEGVSQGNYFPYGAGIYDKWAIQFGYTPDLSQEERSLLLAQSVIDGNKFGTDGQAMSSPGRNIDPRVKRYDLSSDPVAYASQRIDTLEAKIKELPSIFLEEDGTTTEMTAAFYSLNREKGRFIEGASRIIGGVYSNRVVNNQNSEMTPFEAVSYDDQKKTMNLIVNKLLSNDAFVFDENIVKLLQREKRAAYSPQSSGNGDPQLHSMVLRMQGTVLRHVLHPTVMMRLLDSAQYGNTYLPNEVLMDLHNGIFVQREIPSTFKMNLQTSYVDELLSALESEKYDDISKAAIFSAVNKIRVFTRNSPNNALVKDHYKYLSWKIDNYLEG
ncbi:zinc-dependent metalloprotease [Gammaproteobacteria bacterium]|nr:zinc-dependent metalloprotease [Gammaproteobacteria bacterium]MDA8696289.1 zinc-dependent metalloprotease [Gammaproteobacteria bacterium]MDA9011249.1 zinc-dependent metalloprotease [Gammaproteobacteria bacterium]MDA9045134.1 zinc-dependent metalloprotease [Gammaproteobacteria bacterium]MDA9842013.1 zinc-dependent metalloprotease [Gammaproteobacteria bacterium]